MSVLSTRPVVGFVVGIDAGGSKTVCQLGDADGTVLRESRGPGANLQSAGELEVEKVLHDVLSDVLTDMRDHGYAFQDEWFAPHFNFRFALCGEVAHRGIVMEIRQALERIADAVQGTAQEVQVYGREHPELGRSDSG